MGYVKRIATERVFEFEATHHLPFMENEEKFPHKNKWKVTVVFSRELLEDDRRTDYLLFSEILDKVLVVVNNKDLNTVFITPEYHPTDENLCKFIFNRVESLLPKEIRLEYVYLKETEKSGASVYHKDSMLINQLGKE